MRSEAEMFELILSTAQADERVRAVIMNGSRANPNAPRDIFQDYDIVYLVGELESFKAEPAWIGRFGEMLILQLPDDMGDPPPAGLPSYGYLMQFADGARIDLTLFPINRLAEMGEDSQTIALLDKDGLLPGYPPASDRDYLPKPPTAKQYFDCCNEFWWVSPYVAKGLWREEITYAKSLQEIVREPLMKMLAWYVGVKFQFTRSPGKEGKYLHGCLEPALWALLLETYCGAGVAETWQALECMGELFRRTAIPVGEHFGYAYLYGEDERVSGYLQRVKALPRDAQEI